MINVAVARYLLGVGSLAVICCSLAVASVAIRQRHFGEWDGALARLTEAVIGLALLIAILELLGAIGLFRLGPIVATSLAVGVVGVRGTRGARATALAPRPRTRLTLLTSGLAVLTAAGVFAQWASPTLQAYDVGMLGFDSLWYHLPWAASFAQTGYVTPLRFTDVDALTAFYPATAELLHGLGIAALSRDTLSPALNSMWLVLVLVAAWCIGRPRGLGLASVLGAAVVMATPMMHFSQPGSAANDIVGIFFLMAAAALYVNGERRCAALALGGLAAGLAIAVKLTLVGPALALTLGVIAGAPRGARRATATPWVGCLVLASAFWYLRNLIAVGNPLPWRSFGILPAPPQRLLEHTALAVSHYLDNGNAWSHYFQPGLASGLGGWWYLMIAAAVIGPLLCLLSGASRTVRVLGIASLLSLGAYIVTPDTAAGPPGAPSGFVVNLRYIAPALTLSLAVLPLAPAFAAKRRQVLVVVGLGALLVATSSQRSLWPASHLDAAVGIGLVFLLSGAVLLALRGRRRRGAAPLRTLSVAARAAIVLGVLALAGGATAGAYVWQRHYLRGRYAFRPNVSQLAQVWAFFRTVHSARVGLVGTYGGFFAYPLYGLDESDRITYIAHHGPHGAFTPITSCAQWRAAVNAGDFRYLVTTPGRNPWHPATLYFSPEAGWTMSDPAAQVVLRRDALGQQIVVFKLRGRLDPSGCPGGPVSRSPSA
jgi:hypothetical protein